jgi:hypothetical protein
MTIAGTTDVENRYVGVRSTWSLFGGLLATFVDDTTLVV